MSRETFFKIIIFLTIILVIIYCWNIVQYITKVKNVIMCSNRHINPEGLMLRYITYDFYDKNYFDTFFKVISIIFLCLIIINIIYHRKFGNKDLILLIAWILILSAAFSKSYNEKYKTEEDIDETYENDSPVSIDLKKYNYKYIEFNKYKEFIRNLNLDMKEIDDARFKNIIYKNIGLIHNLNDRYQVIAKYNEDINNLAQYMIINNNSEESIYMKDKLRSITTDNTEKELSNYGTITYKTEEYKKELNDMFEKLSKSTRINFKSSSNQNVINLNIVNEKYMGLHIGSYFYMYHFVLISQIPLLYLSLSYFI